jgi:hypothetical protein
MVRISEVLASVPKTESGAIDLRTAKLIGEGGTHALYRFPESPFVIKVMKHKSTLEEIEALERKYAVLYACFDKNGKQRCIQEKHITYPVLLPGKEEQVEVLSLVPYEKCFQSKVKFDFKIEPSELDPYVIERNRVLFARANTALINHDVLAHFNPNDYAAIDERIGALLLRLETDSNLREVMTEFLNNYRAFYSKSNIILDAMGYENILFFKDEDNEWQYKVGSAIKHDTGNYTNELFSAVHAGESVDLNNFVNFTHAYFSPANIRAVNVCAMKLGLDPVIDDVNINSGDLLKISQQLPLGERMLAYARHGDFAKVDRILQQNKADLNFNLRDFWVYPMIADEFIKHGQPPKALKKYLDIVSTFPVVTPANREDEKRVRDAQKGILDRKLMQDRKILLHGDLGSYITQHFKKRFQETKSEEPSLTPSPTSALIPSMS